MKRGGKIMRRANSVAFSNSQGASGELEKTGLLKAFIQDIRLKTATRDFEHAVGMGKMALAQAEKWH
jgi:hypothetical protein